MHIRKKLLIYTTNDHDYTYKETIVLHWQNCMTTKPIYNREVDRMSMGMLRLNGDLSSVGLNIMYSRSSLEVYVFLKDANAFYLISKPTIIVNSDGSNYVYSLSHIINHPFSKVNDHANRKFNICTH